MPFFPFPFFLFLFFFSFVVFSSLFCRSPCSPSPSLLFFLSFCPFPFVSCISFAFIFASLLSLSLGGGFCYYGVSSRRYPPLRAPCEPEVCVFPLRAVLFLPLLMLTFSYFFFTCFPFLFLFGHRFFILSFLAPRFRFLLRLG